VPDRPIRPARPEPREIVELKQLKVEHPELASAVDMQIALLETQRRVQSRVPLPWIQVDANWLSAQYAAGRPVARFKDIPLDWTDFRLTLRQTADVLKRFDALEPSDYERIVALGRDGHALEPLVTEWYEATSGVNDGRRDGMQAEGPLAGLDQVLVLAIRPFLARCGEVLLQRPDLPPWTRGYCPVCGWEPDFAVIASSGERHLICGRCVAQWPFDAYTCPYCGNADSSRVTSFASRDGRYRVYGCDACHRYVKAYDARNAPRPVMVGVDSIATLLLDAAAMQRGYS
jgi:hypothetical protein